MRWPAIASRAARGGYPIEAPTPAAWVERRDVRLDDATVERLALALHERRHGDHVSDQGKVACARLSGAYDDVYAIEGLIVDLIRGAS